MAGEHQGNRVELEVAQDMNRTGRPLLVRPPASRPALPLKKKAPGDIPGYRYGFDGSPNLSQSHSAGAAAGPASRRRLNSTRLRPQGNQSARAVRPATAATGRL